jgi:hypothetical protein
MKRPGYREAINWLAGNDDCYWLGETEPTMSVACCLVCDLFGVEDDRFIADLRRALKRIYPTHAALRAK